MRGLIEWEAQWVRLMFEHIKLRSKQVPCLDLN